MDKMFDIGNKVSVNADRVISIMPIMSASKRVIQEAQKEDRLFDASGRKKKNSVILTKDKVIFISWVLPKTLRKRFDQLGLDK